MSTERIENPADKGRSSDRRISRLQGGSHDHYTCLIPDDIGGFTNLLLKLFYLGIKVDKTQIEILRQLPKDAIVIYVTKYKNYFEYLFYYSRYRQERLPFPQIGFDCKIYLCQPVLRLIKIFLSRLDFFSATRLCPTPIHAATSNRN